VSAVPASGPRACRRCGATVEPQEHASETGLVTMWRCACGWASARTESGVVSRRYAREALERAERGDGDGGTGAGS
jgi:hypothetical protein